MPLVLLIVWVQTPEIRDLAKCLFDICNLIIITICTDGGMRSYPALIRNCVRCKNRDEVLTFLVLITLVYNRPINM